MLGGDDIDEALMKQVAENFKKQNGVDILLDKQAKARLKEACEKAKCELSTATTTTINLPFITATATGPLHLTEDISRAKFEQLVSSVFDKFREKCEICLKDSGKSFNDISDVIMVGGSTRIPYIQNFAKEFFHKEVNKTINPDEAVGQGAAIQGAVLGGDSSVGDVVLLDVTSLSYGIETLGGVFTVMIPRGTTIPTEKTEVFSTASDNQPCVSVLVYEGERSVAKENKLVGKFDLDGIPPAPRGIPKIEIKYSINSNGVLEVTAKDLGTNKANHITISQNAGLSEEEIQNMIKDAEMHKEQDEKFKEDQDTLNHADALVLNLEKQMKDNDDKIPQDLKDKINPLIEDVKKNRESKDIEALKKSMETLQNEAMKIGETIYQASQAAESTTTENPPPNDDSTVDAEVVE